MVGVGQWGHVHMSLMRRIRSGQQGATIVMFTIILFVLLGFAAIAIDAAAAWSQRRENQSAADTGVLAGGIFVDGKPTATAIADATSEAIRITYETIQPDMTFAAWQAEWAACTDPNKPAEFTLSGTSACVSLTADLRKIRVNIPTIDVPTTFGRVLGRDFIGTGAFAEAGTEATYSGGVLPFGLPGAVSNDTEVCLKTGSNPQHVPPCDGPSTGNFAFLDITKFTPTAKCTGDTSGRMARNIMVGADHFLDVAPSLSATPVVDRDVCTAGDFAVEPYTVTTETGNMTGVLHEGLVTGDPSDGTPGRLTDSSNTRSVAGFDVDDTPLWDYLNVDGLALCGTTPTNKAEMIACLQAWTPADGIIFETSLSQSARWAWVPLFWEPTLGSGNSNRTIKEFRPVYLQTTLWKCTSNNCAYIFDPAEPLGGTLSGGGVKLEALSALQLPLQALPTTMQEAQPGTDGDKEFVLLK